MSNSITKNKHNIRSRITGRFVPVNYRNGSTNKSNQFEFSFVRNLKDNPKNKMSKTSCCGGNCGCKIVSGRLYMWKNVVVRAFTLIKNKRFIAVHGALNGFVPDNELSLASKDKVQEYLKLN
jgi:hypothetical protein